MPSANVDAQAAHVGWGAFIILAGSLMFGWYWAWPLLFAWVVVKEWCFDIVIELDPIEGSATDSLFYAIGGVVGALTYWLTR